MSGPNGVQAPPAHKISSEALGGHWDAMDWVTKAEFGKISDHDYMPGTFGATKQFAAGNNVSNPTAALG